MGVLAATVATSHPLVCDFVNSSQKLQGRLLSSDRTLRRSLGHRDYRSVVRSEVLIFDKLRMINIEVQIDGLILANAEASNIVVVVSCVDA